VQSAPPELTPASAALPKINCKEDIAMSSEIAPKGVGRRDMLLRSTMLAATAGLAATGTFRVAQAQTTSSQSDTPATTGRPNIVVLMTDDTGWNDFGCYSGGGATLGHPTPNVDRMAKEGAVFTC
jgi:Sulfatase